MRHVTPFALFEQSLPEGVYYHGTSSALPFQAFSPNMDGMGIVTPSHKRYGGFFFTSSHENALYYAEDLICRVRISGITNCPEALTHSPTALRAALTQDTILRLGDVLDGSHHSDVVVVPYSRLDGVTILDWEFVGEEESYHVGLDRLFEPEGEEATQEDIADFFEMTGGGLDVALTVPAFARYYRAKRA